MTQLPRACIVSTGHTACLRSGQQHAVPILKKQKLMSVPEIDLHVNPSAGIAGVCVQLAWLSWKLDSRLSGKGVPSIGNRTARTERKGEYV